MSKRGQYGLVACLGVIVLLVSVFILRSQKTAAAPEPLGSGTIYYTGPMKSKSDSSVYADEAGHISAPPAPPAKPKSAEKGEAGSTPPATPDNSTGKP